MLDQENGKLFIELKRLSVSRILIFKSIGQNFALVESITVITAVMRQFKIELLPNQKLPPDFAKTITLRMKEPLLCKVRLRS